MPLRLEVVMLALKRSEATVLVKMMLQHQSFIG